MSQMDLLDPRAPVSLASPPYTPDFCEPWQDADEPYRYALGYPAYGLAGLSFNIHDGTILWVMFNPSTATALQKDNTVKKVTEFTRRWGFGRFLVGNLYAHRGTDPKELVRLTREGKNIVGPRNDEALERMARQASRIVVAWGGLGSLSKLLKAQERQASVLHMLRRYGDIYSLTVNNDGSPAHPLFQAYETPLQTFAKRYDT